MAARASLTGKRGSVPGTSSGPKKMKYACVVFIAPTQHGKSTTIDKYYEVQCGIKPSENIKDFVLGNGTTSASSETTMLPPAKISYLSYVEWPDSDEAQRELGRKKKDAYDKYYASEDKAALDPDLSEELYSIRHEEMLGGGGSYLANVKAGLTACVDGPNGEEDLVLTIVDTPGLDDSEGAGADDRIIEGLLDSLVNDAAPDLCAFVFVVKAGMSWSGSFLQSAKRYWDQFPTFRENWIFVHTGMDAFAEDYPSGGCFEEACEIRKRELVSALTNTFDEQPGLVVNLPHVFVENVGVMESKRKAYKKKAEFQQMERAKSYNKLTKIFCSNTMKKVTQLEYRKSNDNETLDAAMMQLFQQRKQGVQSALEPMKKLHGRYTDKMVAMSEEKQGLEHEVRSAQERLDKINTPEKITKAKKTAFEEWTFFGGKTGTYKLKVPYPKSGVTKSITKNMGYSAGVLTEDGFHYSSKDKATILQVTCSSGWMRGYEFEIKLMVDSRVVHSEEISELQQTLKVKGSELEIKTKEYDDLRSENKSVSTEIEVFTKQIEFFGECTFLSQKKMVDLSHWKRLSPFYKWSQSAEGSAAIRNPAYANSIVERFVEVHGLTARYRDVVKG